MAYDEDVAARVRAAFADADVLTTERKMFGGLAFMVGGHMTVGVLGDELMVRVGKDAFEEALAQSHARVMDFTGRPSAGMLYVAPDGFADDVSLRTWVDRGLAFTTTLPPK